jgi:hypothetical protein
VNQQPDTTTLKGKIAVMQAAEDGKRVQYSWGHRGDNWVDCASSTSPAWAWEVSTYRIHPDDLNPPKLRPWRQEEVPVGAQIRYKNNSLAHRHLIVSSSPCGLAGHDTNWDYGLLFSAMEHSTDNGKTWHPCGVLEGQP